VLVALIAALLIGSSGSASLLAAFDQAQASLKTEIEDRERSAQLVSAIDAAERSMKRALKGRGQATEEVLMHLRSHEAKAAEMQPALARLRADAEAVQEQVIRARFELKERMSREEWQKAFSQR
jgi:hypothetical protein